MTEPAIEPHPRSKYWLTTSGATIAADIHTATLVVRLGLAYNAMMAQADFVISAGQPTGNSSIIDSRNSLAAFAVAAAITEETRILINSNYSAILDLARRGGATDDLIRDFGEVNSGRGTIAPILNTVRNRLTFHWDAALVRESLSQFSEHDAVIWLENRELEDNETVCRLAADVLLNAIAPERADLRSLRTDERQAAVKRETNDRLQLLLKSMGTVNNLIQSAIVGYIEKVGMQTHRRP